MNNTLIQKAANLWCISHFPWVPLITNGSKGVAQGPWILEPCKKDFAKNHLDQNVMVTHWAFFGVFFGKLIADVVDILLSQHPMLCRVFTRV